MKKILLLGAGSIGKRHLMNAVTAGGREFVIVDPRADRRDEAKQRAEETYAGLPAAARRQPLQLWLEKSSVDAYRTHRCDGVIIAMPPLCHLDEMERAVAQGVHVFCEKPLTKNEDQPERVLKLVRAMQRKRLVNVIAYNYRFCPQLMQFRQLLQDGVVGKMLTVRGTFSENLREWHPWEGLNFYMSSKKLGGGALLDESHLIDLCRWLFGDIREVCGFNGTVSSLGQERVFETDDLVEILARFESGVIASLHMDLFGKYHQKKLEVIGETGTALWIFDNSDLENNRIEIWRGARHVVSANESRRKPEVVYYTDWKVRNHMYVELMRYFFTSVAKRRHIRPD
ncbi:MAG TPA: Gfo/Idh/MocA family oxidoreductase, partial [bacterium]|nr:Gfo/Idh/MocA family oxidoreductase [bacterium]